MKRYIAIAAGAGVLAMAGCQPQPTPEDRLSEYVGHWNEQEFTAMYEDYLTQGSKEAFPQEAFDERQQQLIEDLGIENLEVSYTAQEDAEWDEAEPAEFPLTITMETLAGPVEFDQKVSLIHEEQESGENWFVEWDPSLIFKNLEEGDEVAVLTEAAERGEIVDREGRGLAINGTGYNLGVVPDRLEGDSDIAEAAELLGLTVESVEESLNQSWVQPDQFVPLTKASKSAEQLIADVEASDVVTYQETAMREYPYGEAFGHLTGYIGSITAEQLEELKGQGYGANDLIGRQGLERRLEERLRGESGARILIQKQEEGAEDIVLAEQEPTAGEDVELTIDAELQTAVYDSMQGEPGSAAAVSPENGETLALISSPGFDPNEFIAGISGERYTELSEDPLNPLFTRFAASYAPGSTIKPVTAAIGMEAGTLDPEQGLEINGQTWQKDSSWGSYRVSRLHPEAPNPIDLNRALVYSDNIYFARQALEMGSETLIDGLAAYGFGEELPFAIELESSQISNNGTLGSEGQLADTSFGQGQMLANILHLASAYEPFLNGGTIYEPTLYASEEAGQVWKEGLISEGNAAVLQENLRNVVTDGYAKSADIDAVPIAGKTGTAELKGALGEEGQENGFFVSYHAEQQDFILAMMIESIEDDGGSDYVAGFSANAMEQYYLNN
ncbi:MULTISPECIES: penicillin-binding transpeptidase domain-containing protein [unclassified Planococcus (in: firmicutes)]|uniref:penicillin-binding transpeptidase domain-containing protein n=1 Tax=unclassified Planococcus (in: firmicutes) TaxID=2662419 RepID=UPI000C7B00DF|nr:MULTISPECIES: penicillin-binding transpeptidase domain-containing protein [unclassified Planococcus (in: firmicutes)]PKG45918.1 peptidoglycan glycosyltransferase [Planococcus sp. Urea-trap-24]PKG89209.1 peptidoglycan glycosyltransferase [Planococcus sp. Urea-3u-39]PKH41618.1 peptidoglycan glycosyltransferase [Planococcus sp. MB-3u-09]